MITLLFLLVLAIFLCTYFYLKSCYSYFENRRIPYLKPKNLFFGSANELCLGKTSMLEFQKNVYERSKSAGLLGLYMFQKPTLYIANISWIKDILMRDFSYFHDRGLNLAAATEPLTQNLFHLEGLRWKNIRSDMMPIFLPNGIKTLFPKLVESAVKLKRSMEETVDEMTDSNLKIIMSKYAADIIGNCAFGLQSNNDGQFTPQEENEKFYRMSKKIFEPRVKTIIKLILPKLPGFISQLFDIKMIATEISDYFATVIRREMAIRRREGKSRNDFLEFMMQLQKNNNSSFAHSGTINEPITDDVIMAQCFMFFIAGYENTTSVLCSALIELAEYPEIQEKLLDEIFRICVDNDTLDISFEKVEKLNYLDMIVSEVIRIYPPATALIRECSKNYNLPGTDIILEKGLQIVIPICGMHRDPQYFPFANSFNPDNFSPQAKVSRSKYAFLAFGDGARSCIGRKFGITQIKIALLMLVSSYTFHPSPKITRPLKFEKKTFITSIEGGAWVRFKKRSNVVWAEKMDVTRQ